MYDVEDYFELLNSHDQDITLDSHVDIWKQTPKTKLRNLSLSLRRTMVVFEVDWIHYSLHQSVSEC
jgi:hypothetical protein